MPTRRVPWVQIPPASHINNTPLFVPHYVILQLSPAIARRLKMIHRREIKKKQECLLKLVAVPMILKALKVLLPTALIGVAAANIFSCFFPEKWDMFLIYGSMNIPEHIRRISNVWWEFYASPAFNLWTILGVLLFVSISFIVACCIFHILEAFFNKIWDWLRFLIGKLRATILNCGQKDENTNAQKQINILEKPIQSKKEDLFSRDVYIESLASLILHVSPHEACYIGVYGKWGDGKTSALNLLKEYVSKTKTVDIEAFIDFSPWKYSEGADLRTILFERISQGVRDRFGRLSNMFSKLAYGFQLQRINSSINSVHGLFDSLRSIWFKLFFTNEYLIECVKQELSRLEKKIVVVVDDLDRLSQEEICQVIRFLKANGDLPNLVYLVLADPIYLSNALTKILSPSESGVDYLEKIIPHLCPLPTIPPMALRKVLEKQILEIIEKYNLEFPSCDNAFDCAMEYITTPRKLKRLVCAFEVAIASLQLQAKNSSYLNVHLGDMLLLTVVKIFEQECYYRLPKVVYEINQATSLNNYLSGVKGKSEHWLHEKFLEYASANHETWVLNFLIERVGLVEDKTKSNEIACYSTINRTDPSYFAEFRLASEVCFPDYFFSQNYTRKLSQAEGEEFNRKIDRQEDAQTFLRQLDDEGKLPQFLDRLHAQKVFSNTEQTKFFLSQLIQLSGSILKPVQYEKTGTDKDLFQSSIYQKIFFVIMRYRHNYYLVEENASKDRTKFGDDILAPLLQELNSFMVLHYCVRHDEGLRARKKDLHKKLFSDTPFNCLLKLLVTRLVKLQLDGRLFVHPEYVEILRDWGIIAYNNEGVREETRAACKSIVDDPEQIKHLCFAYTTTHEHPTDKDRPIPHLWVDVFIALLGEDNVLKMADIIAKNQVLGTQSQEIAAILRWAIQQKKNGGRYGESDQRNFVLEFRRKVEESLNTDNSKSQESP